MSFDEYAIVAEGLSKMYFLYDRPQDRLRQFVFPRLQRLLRLPVRNYFREFWALRDVSFAIRKGETVGIIGRNGSGKSTLLQLVAGTLTPTLGKVQVNGRVSALLELGAGFNPEFTGRENIYLNAAILGMSRAEIDERIDDIIAFADIGDFIDQPVKTYSSGMFVRVAFSTAINVNPDILLVDEALAVGDIAFQQKCLYRIRELQEQGVTILLVSHSNNIIVEYCHRAIFLKAGRVMYDGPAPEAVRAYGMDILHEEGGKTSAPVQAEVVSEPVADKSQEGDESDLPMEISNVVFRSGHGQTTQVFEHNELVVVEFLLKVRQDILWPCFGIQISIPDGVALWHTTTQLLGKELPPLKPGTYRVRWQLRANLGGYRYVIALGAGRIEDGEYKRYHALPAAGYIDVLPLPGQGAGYLVVDPAFEIEQGGMR